MHEIIFLAGTKRKYNEIIISIQETDSSIITLILGMDERSHTKLSVYDVRRHATSPLGKNGVMDRKE